MHKVAEMHKQLPNLNLNHFLHLPIHSCPSPVTFAAMKILMVCLGNICRSPLAEGILKHKAQNAGLDWVVDSAGTLGAHVGEPPHKLSQKVALHHGVDICQQRARRFEGTDFERYDKVYAMSADVLEHIQEICGKKFIAAKADLLLNELYPGENHSVVDPWYDGTEPGFMAVYKEIEKACEAIVQKHKQVTA